MPLKTSVFMKCLHGESNRKAQLKGIDIWEGFWVYRKIELALSESK
jgi:hypothetical protein